MASKNPVSPPPLDSNHDLWVIPPSAHSRWFARIDWYLNWQMSKGLAQQRQKPPLELMRVLEDSGLAFEPNMDASAGPLLVGSAGRIGCERCLVLDFKSDVSAWLGLVHKHCSDLLSKRARVFLPHGVSAAAAQAQWKKLSPLETHLEFSIDEEKAP
jgi:hypothetical protein